MISISATDIQEAFIPVILLDKDGEPTTPAAGDTIVGTTDNAEVGVPSQDPTEFGLVIKSVGDDQPNTGVANITAQVVFADGSPSLDLEAVQFTVGVSATGSASLDAANVEVRDRT